MGEINKNNRYMDLKGMVENMEDLFLDMDGCFTYENATIYYKVTDNWQEKPRVVSDVEKIGRYFHFYNENNEPLGMYRAYEEYEKLQNISHFLAKEYYIKMLNRK